MKRQRVPSKINKRHEAQDPQTPPSRLALLARSSSAEICARVAQNPNATFDTLASLAERYPKQVLQNPSLSLLLLEQPQGLLQFSVAALRALVWCEDVPISILRLCATSNDESVRNIVATCPKTPLDILQSLSTSHTYTRELVARHPNTDPATLLRLCTDPERSVRLCALRRCPAFAERLGPLSAALYHSDARYFSENLWIRQAQYQDPSLLELLFQSGGEVALLWVAMSPRASEAQLTELGRLADKSTNLLSALLSNPALPPALWEVLLARLPSERMINLGFFFQPSLSEELRGVCLSWLREDHSEIDWLATRPVADWVYEALFQSKQKEALLGLAQNPLLPPRYFQPLFETYDFQIACELAQNPATPPALIEALALDWSPRSDTQTAFDFTFEHMRGALQRLVAQNPSVPPSMFAPLASSSDPMVKKSLGQNPKLPAQLLEKLALDPSEQVRASCASHPKLPATLCRLLSRDSELKVRQKIAARSDLSAALAYQLFEEDPELHTALAENSQTPAALLERLADELPTFVARNPNAPPVLLARLARKHQEEILDWVARHPNTPTETLKRLSESRAREVALLHPSLDTAWLYQQKFVHHSEDIPF